MKRTHIAILALLLIAATLVVTGCKGDRTMISSIIQQPNKYMSREVSVGGTVTKSYAINLIIAEAGAYQVDDGSGKIWVITRTGVPAEGQQVGLKGTVGSGLKLGSEILGTVIREIDRRVK